MRPIDQAPRRAHRLLSKSATTRCGGLTVLLLLSIASCDASNGWPPPVAIDVDVFFSAVDRAMLTTG